MTGYMTFMKKCQTYMRKMPLFKARISAPEKEKTNNGSCQAASNECENGNRTNSTKQNKISRHDSSIGNRRPQLAFYCQLAHGSSTGLISGFSNVRELYRKIAECFDIRSDDILFCTLNTHKIEMTQLVGGQIGLDDLIFAHKKGRPKEIELIKTEDSLGLTLTDNGAGYVFVKRIKEGSIIGKLGVVQVGDHLEKINQYNLVGRRHFEVAKMLKDIPKDSTFVLRLVEPQSRNGFGGIGPRGEFKRKKLHTSGSGKETLRFKADGSARIEKLNENDTEKMGIEKINNALERFLGISDNELAERIWELTQSKISSRDLAKTIDSSDLDTFGFTKDFVADLWKIMTETRGLLRQCS